MVQKGPAYSTVAIPIGVKKGIDVWMAAVEIDDGRLHMMRRFTPTLLNIGLPPFSGGQHTNH